MLLQYVLFGIKILTTKDIKTPHKISMFQSDGVEWKLNDMINSWMFWQIKNTSNNK